MLSEQDRREISDLMIRYCNMIDERRLSRYAEVFTPDAFYDLSDSDLGAHRGDAEIIAFLKVAPHPLLHVNANCELFPESADRVGAFSRCLAIKADGTLLLATYRDVLVRTPAGWRMAERVITQRRPGSIPAIG